MLKLLEQLDEPHFLSMLSSQELQTLMDVLATKHHPQHNLEENKVTSC